MSVPQRKSPWYRDGLAFTCTRCGDCCTGSPGYVWVTIDEMRRLAEFRGETVEAFAERFVRLVGDRFSLIEKPGGDCIFWDRQAGCTVYPRGPINAAPGRSGPRTSPGGRTGSTSARSAPAPGQGRCSYARPRSRHSLAMVQK